MAPQSETYLGDGLYARYDGFAVWLRAPRETGDHVCALEPQVFLAFLKFAAGIARTRHILENFAHELATDNETAQD